MSLSHQEIRILRQRLGWSQAEMARRMGCPTSLIQAWEEGSSSPDKEALHQLQFLSAHVELRSEIISRIPIAEREMEIRKMSQLTHSDLLNEIQ